MSLVVERFIGIAKFKAGLAEIQLSGRAYGGAPVARPKRPPIVVYGSTKRPCASVKGFTDAQGRLVEPYTTIGGLFGRATGAPPYALPESWISAKPALNLAMPMNLSTTNDIIGGNSGSPLIDKNAEIVGLIFDGNIFSLGGDYGYDPAKNRCVAVDSRALFEGWRKVYHLNRIIDEIESARR